MLGHLVARPQHVRDPAGVGHPNHVGTSCVVHEWHLVLEFESRPIHPVCRAARGPPETLDVSYIEVEVVGLTGKLEDCKVTVGRTNFVLGNDIRDSLEKCLLRRSIRHFRAGVERASSVLLEVPTHEAEVSSDALQRVRRVKHPDCLG